MNELKTKILNYISYNNIEYEDISKKIHANPEVSNYEFFACDILSKNLEENGFHIEKEAATHRTGFAATKKSKKPGPVIAFLAEYDALQGLGHGCGHNLIGTISVFAAIATSKILDDVGGEIRVYGTPGEEGGEKGAAKGTFIREGYFKDVDIALQVHPFNKNTLTPTSLALDPIDIEFFGKSAHAAISPEDGINALDALILTFNGINALRQHLSSDVRIHGIILDGGTAPNIVPEYSKGRFYIRGATRSKVNDVTNKVKNIVKGAALATGCTYTMEKFQNHLDNLIPNKKLDEIYKKHLIDLNEDFIADYNFASTDAGNVSHVIPTLHPCLKTTEGNYPLHSIEFRDSCIMPPALDAISKGAKLLSLTALDLLCDLNLVEEIKKHHTSILNNQ